MPLVSIETNQALAEPTSRDLLNAVTHTVSETLGKSEKYVMAKLTHNPAMVFAGSTAPLAYVELKSIGLSESSAATLSQTLCTLLDAKLGIPGSRVYIEFANAPRTFWGFNGGTF